MRSLRVLIVDLMSEFMGEGFVGCEFTATGRGALG